LRRFSRLRYSSSLRAALGALDSARIQLVQEQALSYRQRGC
jgi:hypothetical protein